MEQPWNLVFALIPKLLTDGLLERILPAYVPGTFALDHCERYAVDEQHEIRPTGFGGSRRLHGELVGDVVNVALWSRPVHEPKGVAFGVPIDGLWQRLAKTHQIPHLLIGSQQPVIAQACQRADAFLYSGPIECIGLSAVFKPVDRRELLLEYRSQNDLTFAAGPKVQRLCWRQECPAELL